MRLKHKFLLSIILLLLFFLQFIPYLNIKNPVIYVINACLFMIGSLLVFDVITLKFYHKSFLYPLIKSKKTILMFFIVSVLGTFIIEVIAHWIGKLWIYPSWNYLIYIVFAFIGFVFYWLFIAGSYLSVKASIDYFKKGRKIVKKAYKWENGFFKFLGILGIVLLLLSLFLFYFYYLNQNSPFVGIEDLNQRTTNYIAPYYVIMLFSLGLWFVLEYGQHKKRKLSLIKDIIHEHFTPLISIIISSFLFSLITEFPNIFYNIWKYINWPYPEITFIGLPLTMFLAWPIHYVLFLSLWRLITKEQSEEVWKGDLIK